MKLPLSVLAACAIAMAGCRSPSGNPDAQARLDVASLLQPADFKFESKLPASSSWLPPFGDHWGCCSDASPLVLPLLKFPEPPADPMGLLELFSGEASLRLLLSADTVEIVPLHRRTNPETLVELPGVLLDSDDANTFKAVFSTDSTYRWTGSEGPFVNSIGCLKGDYRVKFSKNGATLTFDLLLPIRRISVAYLGEWEVDIDISERYSDVLAVLFKHFYSDPNVARWYIESVAEHGIPLVPLATK